MVQVKRHHAASQSPHNFAITGSYRRGAEILKKRKSPSNRGELRGLPPIGPLDRTSPAPPAHSNTGSPQKRENCRAQIQPRLTSQLGKLEKNVKTPRKRGRIGHWAQKKAQAGQRNRDLVADNFERSESILPLHPRTDFTSDSRSAVKRRANHIGLPSFGHGQPFRLGDAVCLDGMNDAHSHIVQAPSRVSPVFVLRPQPVHPNWILPRGQ